MVFDDLNDGQFRKGEPPYCAGLGSEANSTNKPDCFARLHPAIIILVWSLRVVAVLIAGWAGLAAFFAMMIRFDSSDEMEMVKRVDVEVGGAMALAVVLFFVPNRIRKPVQCALILGVAVLVWVSVSWNLIAHHNWVYRVRSGL